MEFAESSSEHEFVPPSVYCNTNHVKMFSSEIIYQTILAILFNISKIDFFGGLEHN